MGSFFALNVPLFVALVLAREWPELTMDLFLLILVFIVYSPLFPLEIFGTSISFILVSVPMVAVLVHHHRGLLFVPLRVANPLSREWWLSPSFALMLEKICSKSVEICLFLFLPQQSFYAGPRSRVFTTHHTFSSSSAFPESKSPPAFLVVVFSLFL